MRLFSAMAAGLLALAGTPALAAEPEEPTAFEEYMATGVPRVAFNAGAGTSIPLSNAGGRFQRGGGGQVGVTYNFTRRLGLQAEYSFTRYGIQSNVLQSQEVEGSHELQYGDLNAVYQLLPARPLGIYVLGGPGLYSRNVEISRFVGTAPVPYCDPVLLLCFSQPVEFSEVIGSRSRTDFGLNAGVGIKLRLFGGPMHLYLEGRYHYLFGGTLQTPAGPRRTIGQYLPIMFGFRL